MNLGSFFSRLISSLLSNPQVRREARKLGKQAVDRIIGGESSAKNSGSANGGKRRPQTANTLPDRTARQPLNLTYSPTPDGHPNPGEIVWAWVPYEDDVNRGKDRPLLVLAEEKIQGQDVVIGLMLTSRDRGKGDHVDQHGNRWVDIGSGNWDKQGRDSEVRVNRLIQVPSNEVRREGGKLDKANFEKVAKATREVYGW